MQFGLAQGLSCGKSNWRRNQGQIKGAVITSLSKPALQLLIILLEKNQERNFSEKATFSFLNLNKGDSYPPPTLNLFIHLVVLRESKSSCFTLCYFQTREKFLEGRKSQVPLVEKVYLTTSASSVGHYPWPIITDDQMAPSTTAGTELRDCLIHCFHIPVHKALLRSENTLQPVSLAQGFGVPSVGHEERSLKSCLLHLYKRILWFVQFWVL